MRVPVIQSAVSEGFLDVPKLRITAYVADVSFSQDAIRP